VWAAGHGRCRGGVIQPVATCNARTRVWGLMPGRSLRTRETVEVETPALSAMSLMVVDASAPQPMQLLCNRLIYSTVYGGYPVKLLADVRTRVRTIVKKGQAGGVCRARSALHTPPNPLTRSRKQVVSELMSEAQAGCWFFAVGHWRDGVVGSLDWTAYWPRRL